MSTTRKVETDRNVFHFLNTKGKNETALKQAAHRLQKDATYEINIPIVGIARDDVFIAYLTRDTHSENVIPDKYKYNEGKFSPEKVLGYLPITLTLMQLVAIVTQSDKHVSMLISHFNETGESFIAGDYIPLALMFTNPHIDLMKILNLEKVQTYLLSDIENVLFKIYHEIHGRHSNTNIATFWAFYKKHATPEINHQFIRLMTEYGFKDRYINMLQEFSDNVNERLPADPLLEGAMTLSNPRDVLKYLVESHPIRNPETAYQLSIQRQDTAGRDFLETFVSVWAYLCKNTHKYPDLDKRIASKYTELKEDYWYGRDGKLGFNNATICIYLIQILLKDGNLEKADDKHKLTWSLCEMLTSQQIGSGIRGNPDKCVGDLLLESATNNGLTRMVNYLQWRVLDAKINKLTPRTFPVSDVPTHLASELDTFITNIRTMRVIAEETKCQNFYVLPALDKAIRQIDPTSTPSDAQAKLYAIWIEYLKRQREPQSDELISLLQKMGSPDPVTNPLPTLGRRM